MEQKKLGFEEFFTKAIPKLRDANNARLAEEAKAKGTATKAYKGIHSVYSGLNAAFKQYYGKDTDIIAVTRTLAEKKVIVVVPMKGGPMLYLPSDAPQIGKNTDDVLSIILG